jgi:hypothetical protein
MADIFQFVPTKDLKAQENRRGFIYQCRHDLKVFGDNLQWDDWNWVGVVQFTQLSVNSRAAKAVDALNPQFMDFAKAYFRYQQGHKPTGTKNESKALKALEPALLQVAGSADISKISIAVLDEAAQIILQHFSKVSAYHGGRELERLAKFVSVNGLVPADVSNWKSPIAMATDRNRTGDKAKAESSKRMPDQKALDALAEIFANNPDGQRDTFTSSVFAMLMCAPSRISEVLELPVDFEVEQTDAKGILRYGWRFYSGKGFGGDIKWVPTEMVSVAKEAIKRIKALTDPARQLAKWIETNPQKFYRHKDCPDIADDMPLTAIQTCLALGFVDRNKPRSVLSGAKIPYMEGSYSLNDAWEYALARQPKNLPWLSKQKAVKYSNALFCMLRNQLNIQRGTSPVLLWAPTNNVFNNDLSPRETIEDGHHQSIFDRYGFLNADGSRIKLTSHQARHLLNTIAQRGGLSQLQIAKWSGRADVKQNRTYNHMSEQEMVAQAQALDTSLSLFGPMGEAEKHPPITIQEFNLMEKGPVHITEFGVCAHDYTMSPCEKYRDCLNCTEHVCIKGEGERLTRILKRLVEVEKQYEAAKQAVTDGLFGADRWYQHHKNTLDRLRDLVAILQNNEVADGALIQLKNDNEFSVLNRAVAAKLPNTANKQDENMLNDMTTLLGGGFG